MSKPCKHCLSVLRSYNINRIYYTVSNKGKADGNIYYKVEKSKNMISIHESYGANIYYSKSF
jgi:tRNA(Arg) A34 adenosine deaminase TadA